MPANLPVYRVIILCIQLQNERIFNIKYVWWIKLLLFPYFKANELCCMTIMQSK